MEKHSYTIRPLTGVHIGTGEELSPLDYKKATEGSKQVYRKFSSDSILQRFTDNGNDEKAMSDFNSLCENRNMTELRDFFRNNCADEDAVYSCDITDDFSDTGNVWPIYRAEGTPNPVIPGSSIKGAIRTALLNWYMYNLFSSSEEENKFLKNFEREKNSSGDKKLRKLEERMQMHEKLLDYRDIERERERDERKDIKKDMKRDPLRAVLVSDCLFEAEGTQLVGGLDLVKHRQKGSLKPHSKPRIQAEVLRGEFLDGNAVSEICISINNELQKMRFPPVKGVQQKGIKKITIDDIHNSCNYFFMREFQNETTAFYNNINDDTRKLISGLETKFKEAKNSENQFIIRVGGWSQIEFVTFEKRFRHPFLNGGRKGEYRRLFDYCGQYVPLGWCILTKKEV